VLDALAARSGELARLALVDGDTLTWIAKAQGAATGLRYDADAGRGVILHATATGKVWLASLPEARALELVAREKRLGMRGLGPNAVTTLAALKARAAPDASPRLRRGGRGRRAGRRGDRRRGAPARRPVGRRVRDR
jgi:DNA-binding IclR family transcriptional regulator